MKGTYKLAAVSAGVLVVAAIVFINHDPDSASTNRAAVAWNSSDDFVNKNQYNQDLDAIDSKVATLDWQMNELLNNRVQTGQGDDAVQASQVDQAIPAHSELSGSYEKSEGASDIEVNPTSPQDELAAEQQKTRETVAELEEVLGTEPLDQHWAPHMEQNILTAAEQPELEAGSVSNVLCRTSVCRLDIDLADAEAEMQYLHAFVPAAGFNDADAFYTREERDDGSLAMTVYISRDGQSLPGQAFQ